MATAKKAPTKTHTSRGLKQDRARVATKQPYELAVKEAAKKAGPTRKAIEKALNKVSSIRRQRVKR
jgi:hypothetical protein